MTIIEIDASDFLNAVSLDINAALVRKAPVDTGRLKNSVKWEVNYKDSSIDFYMVDYASDVEFGTKPHVIVPKNKKALHWKSGGKDVFAKKVNHPGTRPQPFIRNTFYHDLPNILEKNAKRHLNMDAEANVS